MRRTSLLIAAFALFAAAAEAQAKSPPRDILGLRLGMTEAEIHRRLTRIGVESGYQPAKLEKHKELWEVRHPHIASVAMKFDDEGRLKWITAFARKEGKRLRYRDVADLEKGERLGYYIYVWKVPAHGKTPAYAVMARGADPDYLGNYALYSLPGKTDVEGEGEEMD
jgi:hypothetical protein